MQLTLVLLLVLLPLASFLLNFVGQQKLGKWSAWLASTALGANLIIAGILFNQIWAKSVLQWSFAWFHFGGSEAFKLGILLDNTAAFMLIVVNLVSFLAHIFSISYMQGDPHYSRYFAYLGLFTFSMLGIVVADNLLLIYVFWELVGLSSYLLIGFWYQKRKAVWASQKAFLVNRVGDFGFLIGIILVYLVFGSLELSQIQERLLVADFPEAARYINLSVLGFCLFCGAIGKSAQFPLQVWLPDAMAGPTPVSALIHAATMVAAGVFLLARIFFLLNVEVLIIVTFIGTITAFIGGFSALVQYDFKKVLAYSTISQLGYMVLGMGVGAYEASLFHLLTHAFFKAGLFLSAGAVIHSLHHFAHEVKCDFDAQNIYLYGGLRKQMPFTFAMFAIFTFALAGLPFFSGFLSKDAILSGAWAWAELMVAGGGSYVFYIVPIVGFLTAFLTAVYMGRLMFLVFFGKFTLDAYFPKTREKADLIEDAPWLMRIPLAVLAVGSLWIFYAWSPLSAESGWFLRGLESPENLFLSNIQVALAEKAHHLHEFTAVISVLLSISGFGIAYAMFHREKYHPEEALLRSKRLKNLAQESFYLDKIYQLLFLRLGLRFARLTAQFDRIFIDGIINFLGRSPVVLAQIIAWFDRTFVDGTVSLLVYLIGRLGQLSRSMQGGKVQLYFAIALSGLMLLVVLISL